MPFRSALFLKIAINSFVKKVVQDLTSGGSDPCIVVIVHDKHRFLSTLPARRATFRILLVAAIHPVISIHAPREGSDPPLAGNLRNLHISIHAPREGSDSGKKVTDSFVRIFLSTLPARGATLLGDLIRHARVISIHAPREGSDVDMPPLRTGRG